MAISNVRPETLEERLIYWSIVGTWGFWLIGGLYVLAPALGWMLVALGVYRMMGESVSVSHVPARPFPLGVLIWIASMCLMLVTLVFGHLSFNLGLAQLLKSSIGWAKGWALLAVFPLAGAMLRIRPRIIYRAGSKLALQTLLLTPLFVGAMYAGLPGKLWVSPLLLIGGPGPEFFDVELYSYDASTGNPRWRFFAPWAPGAAFVANIYFILALGEKHRGWKAVSILASAVMCILSQSRLGLITAPAVLLLVFVLSNLSRPIILAIGSVVGTIGGIMAGFIMDIVGQALDDIASARAASTRVRKILGNIAIERWQGDAPIFGHGVVERGPHLVEYMPIGSHHSWYGLLFVKGAVGFAALAIPMAWTIVEMIVKAQSSRTARVGLGVILVLMFYSFGENLEILSYLFWPGLIIIGIAMRQPARFSFTAYARRIENAGAAPTAAQS
jgi:hypothetical protein